VSPQLIVILVICAGLGATHYGAYRHGVTTEADRIEAQTLRDNAVAKDAIAAARIEIGAEVANKIEALRPVYKNINKETVREIIEKPVYRDPNCAVPLSGVLRLNDARSGGTGGTGSVPDAGAAPGTAAAAPAAAAGRPSPR